MEGILQMAESAMMGGQRPQPQMQGHPNEGGVDWSHLGTMVTGLMVTFHRSEDLRVFRNNNARALPVIVTGAFCAADVYILPKTAVNGLM
jgi:hypothetical protein